MSSDARSCSSRRPARSARTLRGSCCTASRFARSDGSQAHGRTTASELCAESMAIKRTLEARAGNTTSFARGMSYRPDPAAAHDEIVASPPDIFSPEFIADPYPHYLRMRDEYPLYFHAPTRAWILSRYDDVRLALTNPAFTTKSYAAQTEPLLGKTIIQLDGREHALQRGLLTPSFREGSIRERFSGLINDTIDELTGAGRDPRRGGADRGRGRASSRAHHGRDCSACPLGIANVSASGTRH